jgi:methyl-accepting chemotaxis protein
MNLAAAEMSEAARRTRDSTSNAVQGVQASTRDLNSVAVAAEQMAARIAEISSQVAHVSGAVTKAVDHARETDQKVADLAGTADKIGDVVRLITSIAGQTNLLALNATIEAARAGDSGKGFAVAAGEVKALAAQTAKATEEIASQIAAIRGATGEAVQAVRDVGLAIGRIDEVATTIAAAVEQQSATTREITASVQKVTATTQEAGRDMRDVSSVSETAEAASRNVVRSADEVGGTADVLRFELAQFLQAISRTDEQDRRRYERISGNGAHAVLRFSDHADIRAEIVDISRGGVSVRTGWSSGKGTEVRVSQPGRNDSVIARIAWSGVGVLALAFRQDDTASRRIDAALDRIGAMPKGRLAA